MAKKVPRPHTSKAKVSIARTNVAPSRITLTDVQRVQVQIIDWKRCAVRCFLIISFVSLGFMFMFFLSIGQNHILIHQHKVLMYTFYGYFINLVFYFFGSGASLKAMSYVWAPAKYRWGITTIIIGVVATLFLSMLGRSYHLEDIFSSNCSTENLNDNKLLCESVDRVVLAINIMPVIAPIAFICAITAIVTANQAINIIPKKIPKILVDAAWLEPYETYDFYVGRNIPRIPGYEEQYEQPAGSQKMKGNEPGGGAKVEPTDISEQNKKPLQ